MDLRNVIFAIALSFAVLFGWSVIFETPQIEEQNKSLGIKCNEEVYRRVKSSWQRKNNFKQRVAEKIERLTDIDESE